MIFALGQGVCRHPDMQPWELIVGGILTVITVVLWGVIMYQMEKQSKPSQNATITEKP